MLTFSSYTNITNDNGKILLINTLSRAVIQLDEEHLEVINKAKINNEFTYFSEEELLLLKNNGFIIESSFSEIDFLKIKYFANIYESEFETITLMPTMQCNFMCKYCFENASRSKFIENREYFGILLKHAQSIFTEGKKIHFCLFGGEPLLKVKGLLNFFNNLKKYKEYFTSSIVTNGYLLSEDIISKLVNDCNCRFIQITFDGPEKIHDSIRYAKGGKATYNTLMQNLKYCLLEKERNDDLAIIARINLLNLSTEDFSSIFDSFSEIQLKNLEVMLRPVFSTGAYKEKMQQVFLY